MNILSTILILFMGISLSIHAQDSDVSVSDSSVSITGADPAPTSSQVKSGNISDADRNMMNTYEHTGYHQRNMEEKFKEECEAAGKSEADCKSIQRGSDATSGEKFMGLSPTMIKALSKAYSMIIGMGGLGATLVSKPEDKKPDADTKPNPPAGEEAKTETAETDADTDADAEGEKEETQDDNCRYIAMGTETIATFMQQKENDQISSLPVSDQIGQVQMLYRQKSSHVSRARGVKTQIIGWGASTACYTAMMTVGGASYTSYKNWLKLGASTLMWRYYSWEKKTHEKAAGIIQNVIDRLGSKGDCNPISDRACYCSQPETQNDPRYCTPNVRPGFASGGYQVSCVTAELKNDPACSCISTNSCLDKRIKTSLADIHVPKTLANALNPAMQMMRGNAPDNANEYGLDSNANGLNNAATNLLSRSSDLLKVPKGLSQSQKEQAEAVGKFLPNKVAKTFSKARTPSSANKASKKFSEASSSLASVPTSSSNRRMTSNRKGRTRLRGGSGLDGKSARKRSVANPFAKRGTRTKGQVLKFANRASKSAQIYKDKGLNIFDVVSNRYRKTAKKRLNVK
ncbi:MAG: hypothetical protein VX341_02120 [Bdellovibrionota bacterium]|nr:hypothetical protein [Bdellovibrionota bacterium]